MNKVYVKTDITGRIVSVNSDAFMSDTGAADVYESIWKGVI